ncbi:MAG TPA: DsrE/DsrF/DrsH-like family protein [Ktedonobacterales bacterium]|nr:DsrE/DsrF/DrsH-like family protein [Ktedonobacterales bacterium]
MYGEFPLEGQGQVDSLLDPAGSMKPATANRLAIVLFSGTMDKLLSASIMATGAAAMGMDVEIFLTNWGALAFRKDDYKTNKRVSADFADYQSVLLEQMAAKHVTSWMENLEGAKEIGNVHIAACSHTMTLFDLRLEDLEPMVDEVTGVAAFVERARDSAMTLYI